MATETEFAPAKVNLCLHVTGRRADGYHLLSSLVVFAGVGDRVTVTPDAGLSLRLTGPRAAGLLADETNLCLRAARAFGPAAGAAITLDKVLPVASGIGGGSADAAAVLRALARLWGRPLPPPEVVLRLGADVPVCLAGRAARMTGVGEGLEPVPALPPLWMVLANPGVAVPTPAVFAALTRRDNPAMPPLPAAFADGAALVDWLGATRNDLEAPAEALAPVIGTVRTALAAQPGCRLARMSGSGATVFGLFDRPEPARAAEAALARAQPGWWVAAAPVQP